MTNKQKAKLWARLKSPAFYIAVIGAGKLVAEAFGHSVITDEQVNVIANGVATLATVIGVAIGYE